MAAPQRTGPDVYPPPTDNVTPSNITAFLLSTVIALAINPNRPQMMGDQ